MMIITNDELRIINGDSKESALRKMIDFLFKREVLENPAVFFTEVMEREKLSNTHIGSGVVLVHTIAETVKKEGIYLFHLNQPLQDWYFDEKHPIRVIVLYAINSMQSENLIYFRKFSAKCGEDEFLQQLADKCLTVKTIEEMITN